MIGMIHCGLDVMAFNIPWHNNKEKVIDVQLYFNGLSLHAIVFEGLYRLEWRPVCRTTTSDRRTCTSRDGVAMDHAL